MINRISGHFEEKDGDKYLIISPKNVDTLQKYQEVFDRLKEIIKKINDYSQPIKYDGNCMKNKFNTDDNIPLNKIIYLPTITITIRSITKKDNKYYPQVFLDDLSIECDICHYRYFLDKNFNYEKYLGNECHDLMQKAMNFNDVAIVSIKVNDYRIHFWYMSKDELAISIMHNSILNE